MLALTPSSFPISRFVRPIAISRSTWISRALSCAKRSSSAAASAAGRAVDGGRELRAEKALAGRHRPHRANQVGLERVLQDVAA